MKNYKASTKRKLKIRTPDKRNFWKWLAILGLSTLPFLHDVFTEGGVEGVRPWVPDLGIQRMLMDKNGFVLGFSTYRVFLYTFFIHLTMHIAFVAWWFDAVGKRYRPAILLPMGLTLYQLVIIVTNSRQTQFNEPGVKIFVLLLLMVLMAANFFFRNKNIGPPPKS